jgi:hypothetical protein
VTDVDRLLAEYIEEHRGGGAADPTTFLARAVASDRRELAALIDGYLSRAPRQPFDAVGFRGSRSERVVDELERSLGGQAGLWPALLPELRHRAGLKRAELVTRLAGALGVAGREPKVATYYHQMEQGILPARGVSERVLAALGGIVGASLESLREAGEALTPFDGEPVAPAAFARRAQADPSSGMASPEEVPPDDEWDEIDTLFRGG